MGFSDLEREFNEKQANVEALEKEVTEGRKRCAELEEELDQVNREIGDARVSFMFKQKVLLTAQCSISYSLTETKQVVHNDALNLSKISSNFQAWYVLPMQNKSLTDFLIAYMQILTIIF